MVRKWLEVFECDFGVHNVWTQKKEEDKEQLFFLLKMTYKVHS